MTELDPASMFLGALIGAVVALIILLHVTRRCNCLPDDFRESDLK